KLIDTTTTTVSLYSFCSCFLNSPQARRLNPTRSSSEMLRGPTRKERDAIFGHPARVLSLSGTADGRDHFPMVSGGHQTSAWECVEIGEPGGRPPFWRDGLGAGIVTIERVTRLPSATRPPQEYSRWSASSRQVRNEEHVVKFIRAAQMANSGSPR